MFKLQNIGCLVLVTIVGLCIYFGNVFLVPIVPLLIGLLIYYNSKQLKSTIFAQSKNLYELTAGAGKLEGRAIARNGELSSPYFNETCIGYIYTEEEQVPNDDGYFSEMISQKMEVKDFVLQINSGSININATQLDLRQLPSKTKTEHSLKNKVNDMLYTERTLKNNDEVVIFGEVKTSLSGRFEMCKHENQPFFVTTKSKVEGVKISYQIFLKLLPWLVLMYIAVNYFLFFAPLKDIPKNDAFAYFTIFGLPILFVIFWLMGKEKEDWLSRVFQYLGSVCILTSLLNFPLIILFYMIDLSYFRMLYVEISIMSITALGLLFNFKTLVEYDSLTKKK